MVSSKRSSSLSDLGSQSLRELNAKSLCAFRQMHEAITKGSRKTVGDRIQKKEQIQLHDDKKQDEQNDNDLNIILPIRVLHSEEQESRYFAADDIPDVNELGYEPAEPTRKSLIGDCESAVQWSPSHLDFSRSGGESLANTTGKHASRSFLNTGKGGNRWLSGRSGSVTGSTPFGAASRLDSPSGTRRASAPLGNSTRSCRHCSSSLKEESFRTTFSSNFTKRRNSESYSLNRWTKPTYADYSSGAVWDREKSYSGQTVIRRSSMGNTRRGSYACDVRPTESFQSNPEEESRYQRHSLTTLSRRDGRSGCASLSSLCGRWESGSINEKNGLDRDIQLEQASSVRRRASLSISGSIDENSTRCYSSLQYHCFDFSQNEDFADSKPLTPTGNVVQAGHRRERRLSLPALRDSSGRLKPVYTSERRMSIDNLSKSRKLLIQSHYGHRFSGAIHVSGRRISLENSSQIAADRRSERRLSVPSHRDASSSDRWSSIISSNKAPKLRSSSCDRVEEDDSISSTNASAIDPCIYAKSSGAKKSKGFGPPVEIYVNYQP